MIAGVCFSQAAGGNGKADSTAAGALSCSVACSFLVCVSSSIQLMLDAAVFVCVCEDGDWQPTLAADADWLG